ncbi:hypothetical protein OFY01_28125 [Streptomyces sp. GXMU-J5]|uniref:Cytochrome C oxidase subunit I n=2 Tax=Streptomyces beihaiensis TaxID=2984495 RepID=A0ABT3U2L8_9ACTN|nr:hypothetical protein [Streptomyces beihaiensis]MCX3063560.1 hypothetical protein [Streptomyces beihaiensis]
MRRPASHASPRSGAGSPEEGLRQLDGYLYWQAELDSARSDAETFCDQFPWLTTYERAEVVDRYTQERTAASEAMTRRVAARCVELREEYTARYRRLRARVVAAAAALFVAACLAREALTLHG